MCEQEQENESSSLATLIGREINDYDNEFPDLATSAAEEERKKEEGFKDKATGTSRHIGDSFKNIDKDQASGTDNEQPRTVSYASYSQMLANDLEKKMKDMDKNQQKLANDAIRDILEKGSMGLLKSQPVQKPSTSNKNRPKSVSF